MTPLPSRRLPLQTVKVAATTHAGLWLDKYSAAIEPATRDKAQGEGAHGPGRADSDNGDPRQALLREAAGIAAPEVYTHFFARWQQALGEMGVVCKCARALGRIAIGLGSESVIETAITLHHTYGVPYLPGSALKGLAASFAAQRLGETWQAGSDAYRILFGNTRQAGYITFYDAYPYPAGGPFLAPDIMAVHHPRYYRGEAHAAPADWDDPSLVPFPTATGCYLVALAGPPAPWARPWVDVAFQILGFALQDMGIGAKTSSGYGRMVLEALDLGAAKRGSAAGADDAPAPTAGAETYLAARRRLLTEQPPKGRQRGVVAKVTVRPEGGTYGFITPAGGGGDIYVNPSRLTSPGSLREGQVVEFAVAAPGSGNKRAAAENVTILRQPDP